MTATNDALATDARASTAVKTKSRRRDHRRDPFFIFAVVVAVALLIVTIFAPVFAPKDPLDGDVFRRFADPGNGNVLGTDEAGRDVLSRLIYGGRVSLRAGIHASLIAAVFGVSLGLIAGYVGGWVDRVLSRLNDALMSLPGIVLALAFVAVLGPGIGNSMTAVGIVFIPRFFRVTRATTLGVRESTFIEGLVAMGAAPTRIVGLHVTRNIMSPLVVEATFVLSSAILAEASLSFLGLGVRPPAASWGGMLASAKQRPDALHLVIAPGVVLSLTILSITLIGDHLRSALGVVRRTD
jgi:peptide/nickel transport system permease protein